MSAGELEKLEQKLIRIMARTSIEHGLLSPGDRILVAVSGGKDSYSLLHLLELLRRRLPFSIDLLAVHVSQGQPGVDASPLVRWLENSNIPFDIAIQDTFSTVRDNLKSGANPCSICARMRRGILYTFGRKHGCNKIALGHHREDTLSTLLMNLFYGGKLQAMPASYTTDDGRFQVIRPLIEVAQSDLIELSRAKTFPIVPCFICAERPNHKRKAMEDLMNRIEAEHPRLKQVMLGAIKNVKPTHLLDPKLFKRE